MAQNLSRREALKKSNQSLNGMDPVLSEPINIEEPSADKTTVEKTNSRSESSKTPKINKKKEKEEKVGVTISLPEDLSAYFTIKANRSGKTIQLYFEDLIKRNAKSIDKVNPYDINLNKYHITKTNFARRSVFISKESKEILKKSSASLGMKIGDYTYYIIDQERINDKESPDFK